MTVYKIEADLLDVSTPAGEEYCPGHTHVSAQGGGEFHTWTIYDGERCWVGDRVTVVVVEDDPEPSETALYAPPPVDKRGRK